MLEKVLRRAGSDALKYFPVRFVPALTSLITVKVFTNAIAPAEYGNFSLINATTSLLQAVATAWIASSIIRFYWIAKREERMNQYIATTTWLTLGGVLAGTVVVGAVAWLFRGSISPELMRLVPVGLAAFVVGSIYATLLNVMRAANRSTAFALLSISMTLVTTALSLWLVWSLKWGAVGVLAGSVIGHLVLVPFIVKAVAAEGSMSPRLVDRDFLREFASYGVPLMLMGLSAWILVLADRYVIALLRGAGEVGLYSVAYGLGEKIMMLIAMPLILTITPSLIETYEKEGQELAQRAQTQLTRYFAMVTFPLLAGMFVAGADFMRVFTDERYWGAWPILGIVAAGVMLNYLSQLAGSGLGLYKKSKIIMSNAFIAAAFNVVANLALVGKFGYMAAAYNTLAAYGLFLALAWIRTRPYMAWEIPWLDIGRVALACLVMVAALYFAFPGVSEGVGTLALQALAGLIVYAAALLGLGGVRKRELAWVGEVAVKAGQLVRIVPRRSDDGD